MPTVQNYAVIVGIDEAGRGAIAGPVVAGACVQTPEILGHPLVRDSKSLTALQREEAYEFLIQICTCGVGIVDAQTVDKIGILCATEKAMQEAVAKVAERETPTYLLIDGRDQFWFDYPKSTVVRGDQLEDCIAAASIIAKVTRDRMMKEYAEEFPLYGFAQHKGYGTPEHQAAVKDKGLCVLHRRTFIHP